MRAKRLAALGAAWVALWAIPGCDPVGGSGPGGEDAGTDADADGDTDVDTDADTDPCADVQPYCCTEECPCADTEDRCLYTYDGATMDTFGVCKPEASGAECWIYEDCADGEFCAGVFICPCEMDCDWEGPGICSPVSGACCEDASVECPDDYFCLDLGDGTSTCHGILGYPRCWTDDECFGAAPCVDEVLCACDVDCVSVPGICWMYEYK